MTREERRRAAAELVATWPAFDEPTKADLAALLRPAVSAITPGKAPPAQPLRRAA